MKERRGGWRNGSASDSREKERVVMVVPEGCRFKSCVPQSCFFLWVIFCYFCCHFSGMYFTHVS